MSTVFDPAMAHDDDDDDDDGGGVGDGDDDGDGGGDNYTSIALSSPIDFNTPLYLALVEA